MLKEFKWKVSAYSTQKQTKIVRKCFQVGKAKGAYKYGMNKNLHREGAKMKEQRQV